ncbi:MAG TPA: hypothetical protein VG125_29800 [Pirellulales bacterium]|jgi:hypothetical protein|nr:hypothetical protein [Pirellulales bacterium]
MLRIQPIGYAPFVPSYETFAVNWYETEAIDGAPWRFDPRFEIIESFNALVDTDYVWLSGDKPPLQNVSSALTIENALLQRNLLLQCGVGNEHVGMLVVYGQYSAKGASLQAVMPAVWASTEYAKLVDKKRSLLHLPLSG